MVKSCWGAINQRAPCTLEVSASDGLDVLVKRSDRSLIPESIQAIVQAHNITFALVCFGTRAKFILNLY